MDDYKIYIELRSRLQFYLENRINIYMYLEYYKGDIQKIPSDKLKYINDKDLLPLYQKIYQYDYNVFKVLLFLYLDFEKNIHWDMLGVIEVGRGIGKMYYKAHGPYFSLNEEISKDFFDSSIAYLRAEGTFNCGTKSVYKSLMQFDLYSDFRSSMIYNHYPAQQTFLLYVEINNSPTAIGIESLNRVKCNDEDHFIGRTFFHNYGKEGYEEWLINSEFVNYNRKITYLQNEYSNLYKLLGKLDGSDI